MKIRFRRYFSFISTWTIGIFVGYWTVIAEREHERAQLVTTRYVRMSVEYRNNTNNELLALKRRNLTANIVNKTAVYNIEGNFTNSENEYFVPRSTKVNLMDAEFLIPNKKLCEVVKPFLIVMVPSIFKRVATRDAIRNTYGSYKKHGNLTIKLIFLFGTIPGSTGQGILQESRKYGDIVQADFMDSYQNLTYKILYGLKWVATYCNGVKFVVKADQDVFVFLPFLLDYLLDTPYGDEGAIYGNIYGESLPHRWKSKWRVTLEQYPLTKYPPHASGVCYVISGNIVQKLFMAAEHMPYLPVEDAYITGCLVKTIGARTINNQQFSNWLSGKPDLCNTLRDRRISAIKTNLTMFYKFWGALNSFDKECDEKNK